MTYGGKWNGAGPKIDVNSWKANTQLTSSSVSKDARRVSQHIWKALSTKGQCILSSSPLGGQPAPPTTSVPSPIVTDQPTSKPTQIPSKLPTTPKPTKVPSAPPTPKPTYSPTAVPTPSPSTSPTSSKPTKARTYFTVPPEDGRIWYQPSVHCMESVDCLTSPGIMFDVGVLKEPVSYGVRIESLLFEHIRRNATVDVYTIEGSSTDGEQVNNAWQRVGSIVVNAMKSSTKIDFDSSIVIPPGRVRGFYLFTRDTKNFFLVGPEVPSSTPWYDSNGISVLDGSVRFGTFGTKISGYYPTVQVGYEIATPPSTSPSAAPTPISKKVETYYTISPGSHCKDDCFAAPGFMFNVRNTNAATSEISITRISFEHLAPQQEKSVDLYRTIRSSYSGNEQNPSRWVKIAIVEVPKLTFNTVEFALDNPITLSRGEIVAFYIQTEENILLVRQKQEDENPTVNKVQLLYGSSVMNGAFRTPVEGYSWNGEVTFSSPKIAPAPSTKSSFVNILK